MFPASEGTPNPVPAGSETQKLLDELGGLKNDLVGAPEAGAPAQGGVPLPTETMTAREDVLPDWMRYPAEEVPDTGKQVIEGIAVAAPTLDVEPPDVPVAPGGDGGKGPGEGGAKIEPRAKKSSEALEKEQSLLKEFKLAHEISAQAAACAERPWPESVEAIKGRRELTAASLSSLKETMNGVGLAPGDEVQVKAQREKSARTYLKLQTTIDGLNLAGLEKRAAATMSEVQRLKTESSEVYGQVKIENIKVDQEVKAWTKAEETARANGLPEEGLVVFQVQRQNAENRLAAIKAKAGYLFLETSEKNVEAEQAEVDFKAAQVNIQRLEAEKAQARLAAENWQKKLVDPERQLAGMRQQAAGLENEIAGLDNILRTENIYTEVAQVADAFDQLNPSFIHQGGVETDLLQAMREGFPGTQVERDYIFTLAQQPEYANMTISQLQQVFRDRSGRMNRILELEAVGTPEDMVRKLLTDPNYPDFPASFRSAVESTIGGRPFLAELPPGNDPVLSRANRAQRKVYTDIMFALGLNPQTPEASEAQNASLVERARSGAVAKQMAELYAGESLPPELQDTGAEYGTEEWEIWKENVMKWSRDKVHQQQLNNYANPKLAAAAEEARQSQEKHAAELEEQQRQAVNEQNRARFAGKESGLREAEIEAAKASLAAEFAVEFGAGLPVGTEAPREGQSAEEWRNEVRGQLIENAKAGLADLAEKLRIAGEGTDAEAQRTAARYLVEGMVSVHRRIPEMREEVARIYSEALDVRPEGEDKKHDKGVADRMKEFADLLGGKMDVDKLAERLANTGVGPLRRERTDEEKEEIGEQVMGAEIRQMENIRAGGGLTKENAEEYAGKMKGLNAALEGAGILSAGTGSLLDAGFQLAIQTMFGGK